ncbi:MAG: hypothetical protein J4473_04600 [Candidatus Aenigmarchaeota archaeon]|nr:hypothetical protein [Candidatus Aenigmarchaeota archaeon]
MRKETVILVILLAVIALVTVAQAVQISDISGKITVSKISPAGNTQNYNSAPAAQSAPTMVGGC